MALLQQIGVVEKGKGLWGVFPGVFKHAQIDPVSIAISILTWMHVSKVHTE